ncbi:hypothetical protein B0H10DRAFT_1945808 [Mycena sp. CBHHK59/15]|nr:hypothetical protein B0H10DRAFT_1945808 [Mycena sp. CBHHK59/15]
MLITIEHLVNHSGAYVQRLKARQELAGNEHIAALDSLFSVFENAGKRLDDLKTKLRGGWLDFGVYSVIREVDEELEKAFNSCMPLATFELVQALKIETSKINYRLSRMEDSAMGAEAVQSGMAQQIKKMKEGLSRLSQRMNDIHNLLLVTSIANQAPLPEAETRILAEVSDLLVRHSVHLQEIDSRNLMITEDLNSAKLVSERFLGPGLLRYSVIVDRDTLFDDLERLGISNPSSPSLQAENLPKYLTVPTLLESRGHHRSTSEGPPSYDRDKLLGTFTWTKRQEAVHESFRLELARHV